MSIDSNKLQMDSRDYLSIYQDLTKAIPNLTKLWNTTDENDAGIVLVKLMSMYGDMLSYNHDRSVLECYPATVTQRKNANQVFGLLGYKMHWYQSARCYLNISTTEIGVKIPKYSTFVTPTDVTYTYVGDELTVSQGDTLPPVEVVQGIPRTPNRAINPQSTQSWYDIYDFNVYKEDLVLGNKIYLSDNNVDETTITLIDDGGYTWQQVKSVDTSVYAGRYFSVQIDDYGKPYLELPTYWENFNATKFKLFYLVSSGIDGQIQENLLRPTGDLLDSILVTNTKSTYGYNYETPEEARDNYMNFVGTFDTLVTLSDFEKAAKRLPYVANCIATDIVTDPDPTGFTNTMVRLNVTKTPQYETDPDVENYIVSEINKNKIMLLDIDVKFDTIKYYTWNISGTVYLKEQVDVATANGVLVAINNQIQQEYSKSNVGYNQIVGFQGVVNTIEKASALISSIEPSAIEYSYKEYDSDGNLINIITGIGQDEILGMYRIVDNSAGVVTPDFEYNTTLPNVPIKKTSLIITVDNNRFTIYDDGKGNLFSDSIRFVEGTIDYDTGDLYIKFDSEETRLVINYSKNVINMVLPEQPLDLFVSETNIKR